MDTHLLVSQINPGVFGVPNVWMGVWLVFLVVNKVQFTYNHFGQITDDYQAHRGAVSPQVGRSNGRCHCDLPRNQATPAKSPDQESLDEAGNHGQEHPMTTSDVPNTILSPATLPAHWSLADLQRHLGDIPLERIRVFPPPGYATEQDVSEIEAREDRLFELEDGVLVEKPMGWYESIVAMLIGRRLGNYLDIHDLGQVLGADGAIKLMPGLVKIPDLSFLSWTRFPRERLGRRPIPQLIPDLVVEVLSETNTNQEMEAKLKRYFEAGVRLVWYVDPASRSAAIYTSPSNRVPVAPDGELDGGDVLPGFTLPLCWLFEQADRQGTM